MTVKDHQGTFRGNERVLDHNFGDGYTTVGICEILPNSANTFMNYMYANYTSIQLPRVNLMTLLLKSQSSAK